MNDKAGTIKVWDLPLRLFHWLLVATVAVAFLSAEEGSPLNQWHVLAGWVAGILILFRLAWGFIGGEHSRFADFIRPSRIGEHLSALRRGRTDPSLGHNPLGAIAVVILLALTALTVWTGAFGGEAAEDAHELIGWSLLAMIAVHIAAVIIMSVFERENLVRAMVSGSKPEARHQGAADARRPGLLAYLAGAAVIGAGVYGVLRYDPQAFTLRSSEAFEHRANSGDAARVAESHEDDERE
jgi:cytochrome b